MCEAVPLALQLWFHLKVDPLLFFSFFFFSHSHRGGKVFACFVLFCFVFLAPEGGNGSISGQRNSSEQ